MRKKILIGAVLIFLLSVAIAGSFGVGIGPTLICLGCAIVVPLVYLSIRLPRSCGLEGFAYLSIAFWLFVGLIALSALLLIGASIQHFLLK